MVKYLLVKVPKSELDYGNGVKFSEAKKAYKQGWMESANKHPSKYVKHGIKGFKFVFTKK